MKTMTQKQQGFTLIELMIVVAIIGILAAIALPAYQDYTARAQASEAVSLTAAAKTGIAEYYQSEGAYPVKDGTPDVTAFGVTGTYSVVTVETATGVISAKMNKTGVSKDLQDRTFTFTPSVKDGAFKWTCTHDLVNKAIAPKGCKAKA
ncbi:pilin [Pseudoalteromonas arctica]|uniref:Type IV pilus assembly protein PilA n=1 Tax=Pseudoalteromonas arctica A 37-1-2 TaxID=1117313 RepID=A0A290S9G8_9GAMM|nr:pilin [Pseudoalteromonas arctica]ATC87870.1 type IV pilus assembly protein PilA [Pseudoalteromonas arctica A 37-1-2]